MTNCSVLERLTKFSIHTTYECITCGNLTSDVEDANIRYENLHEDSIAQILISFEGVPPILKECERCQKNTSHEEVDVYYELPDLLIICLNRFEEVEGEITKNCSEVDPSPHLQFDDITYSLSVVVTHSGEDINQNKEFSRYELHALVFPPVFDINNSFII